MKDKYKRFKRQNMMGYEVPNHSQQTQLTEANKGFSNRNPLRFRNPNNWKELLVEKNSHESCLESADIYQIMLSEQLEEMFEKNHNHLYHWLNSGQGKKWLEMRI